MEWSENETTRSINEYAILLLKTSIFVNGAATLAIIAFLGNIWSPNLDVFVIVTFARAIKFFIVGVWLAVAGLSLFLFRSLLIYILTKLEGCLDIDKDDLNKRKIGITNAYIFCVSLCAIFSIMAFPLGVNRTSNAFTEQSSVIQNIQDVSCG